MDFRKIILVVVCLFSYTITAYAEDRARVVYGKPENTTKKSFEKQFETSDAIESVVTFINDYFRLPGQLVFFFGGEDGPLYDSGYNRIFIPYNFVVEIENRFIEAKYKETGVTANEATKDALMHTMFHELAHAIIFMYELPVLGKEEDAADALATILLIEFFEDGQEIALSAADLFDLESNNRKVLEDEDFWDEHSLDEQRYYSTLCLVYGSAPEKYVSIVKEEYFSEERAKLCIEEYESISQSWFRLLRPHIKYSKIN